MGTPGRVCCQCRTAWPDGAHAHIDAEIFERTIDINLVSIWHQIAAFDGLLRQSEAGRALLVSSGAAHGARAFWGGYAVSKAGLEAMGRAWAAERANQFADQYNNPGGTKTAMRALLFRAKSRQLAKPGGYCPCLCLVA